MKQEKLLLWILALLQFTNIVDFVIMMPLGPKLMSLFHIQPKEFGLIVSAYAISAFVSALAGAFLMDKYDRKKALLVIYIGFTIGTFACGLAPTYPFLVAARALTGVFGGIIGGLVLAIVGDVIPQERRAGAMGIVMSAFSVASVLGVPFGIYLANKFQWHAPFFFLGGLSLLITVLIVLFVPSITIHLERQHNTQDTKPDPFVAFTSIARDTNQIKALLFMVALVFGQFAVIPYISTAMVANVGFTEDQLPLIYLAGGLCSMVSSPLIGKLADRYGRLPVFTIFALLALIPMYLITNMGKMSIVSALVITSVFFVVSGGRMVPAMTMITSTVLPRNRGSFMSINSAVQQLASGISSYIGGLIVVRSVTGTLENFHYVGYLAIATGLITVWLARHIKSAEPAAKVEVEAPVH